MPAPREAQQSPVSTGTGWHGQLLSAWHPHQAGPRSEVRDLDPESVVCVGGATIKAEQAMAMVVCGDRDERVVDRAA